MNIPRGLSLVRQIENAPTHAPHRVRPHLWQEYQDLADHAPTINARHEFLAVVTQLRRGLRRG